VSKLWDVLNLNKLSVTTFFSHQTWRGERIPFVRVATVGSSCRTRRRARSLVSAELQAAWKEENSNGPVGLSRYSEWLRTGRLRGRSSSSGRSKNSHFSISSRPALGPLPAFYSMGIGCSFPQGSKADWAWKSSFQLVPRLRKRRSMHSLPHTSSWRSA
jgi:hypothetical protein